MTKEEIAKIKSQFIRDKQVALMKITGAAERQLLDEIYNALFDELGKSGGAIASESGSTMKLSVAIEKVFKHFQQNKSVDIINGIVADLKEIGDLNKQYFSMFRVRAQRLSAIVQEVETMMQQRIGIDENGKIVKGSYLSNLIYDTTLKNAVQKETRAAMANGLTIKQMMNNVKEVIVGNPDKLGGLSSQYRTFVHDTYAQYDNGYANGVAQKIGLNAAVYAGGLIATSRELCISLNNTVLSRGEIAKLKQSPLLLKTKQERNSGVVSYNPFTDMGRWNCRHNWNWVTDAEAIKMRPAIKLILDNEKSTK
jgi:hypothetical protein